MRVQQLAEPSGEIHSAPGYHRDHKDKTLWWTGDGEEVTDPAVLERLAKLALPPAWRHVWVAPDPEARVQARGIDSRGRTQYRYSAAAVEQATRDKFAHMLHYAKALPHLRELIHLRLSEPTETPDFRQVTALAARYLDLGLFRVGSDRYARDNNTYGLTTLRTDHVTVAGNTTTFDFVGKEHVMQHHEIEDELSARMTARLLELHALATGANPTSTNVPESAPLLFSVPHPAGAKGRRRSVKAATLNSYVHGATGAAASVKMARTWGATVIAAAVIGGARFDSPVNHRDQSLVAFDAAAAILGNTPTMARSSYVHPAALEIGQSSRIQKAVAVAAAKKGTDEVKKLFFDPDLQESVRQALEHHTQS